MPMERFWRHLRILMWKNYILKRRAFVSSLFEFLLPLLSIAALIGIWSSFPTDERPTSEYSMTNSVQILPLGALAFRLKRSKQYLAILPANPSVSSAADTAYSYFSSMYGGLNVSTIYSSPVLGKLSIPPLSTVLMKLESEDDLTAHIKDRSYGEDGTRIFAAIVINSGPPAWDYTIRLNSSETVDTSPPYYDPLQQGADLSTVPTLLQTVVPSFGDNLAQQSSPDPIQQLPLPGFLSLQLAMDRMIINRTISPERLNAAALTDMAARAFDLARPGAADAIRSESQRLAAAAVGGDPAAGQALARAAAALRVFFRAEAHAPQQATLVPFPTPASRSDGFFAVADAVFALLLTLSYLHPVSRLIRAIVSEKEDRLREGLHMMGLAGPALSASWLATYAALFATVAAASAGMACATFFAHTDGGLVFLAFLLFGWASVAWAYLVSAFFRPRPPSGPTPHPHTFPRSPLPASLLADLAASALVVCKHRHCPVIAVCSHRS
jgi:hypothetical protein